VRRRGPAGIALAVLLTFVLSTPRGQGQTVPPSDAPGPAPLLDAPAAEGTTVRDTPVWGLAGLRLYGLGEQVAPNGLEFTPLFSIDLNFNFWLWRSERVYLYADDTFWAQRAAPGVTNPTQGPFDFSKREFDFTGGAAWNYSGPWELRGFAYSFNNLNRGESTTAPSGYADGIGLENRYYLSDVYANLGTDAFDAARAPFLSVGYYPSKTMVDGRGLEFKPGPFVRADLQYDLLGDRCYLYGDGEFLGTRSFTPKLLQFDAGVAFRPWDLSPRLEFRIGTQGCYDLRYNDLERTLYGAVRIVY